MKKLSTNKILIYSIIMLLLIVSVNALTYQVINKDKIQVTFSSGTIAIIENMNYDRQKDILTIDVNVTNRDGLTIQDVIESKKFLEESKGMTNKYKTCEVRIQ